MYKDIISFWKEFDKVNEPPFVHPQDKDVINKVSIKARTYSNYEDFAKRIDNFFEPELGLHLGQLPIPYKGDLEKSTIFIVLGNPGFDYMTYKDQENIFMRNAIIDTIRQDFSKSSDLINYPNIGFNPNFFDTSGAKYFLNKFRDCIVEFKSKKNNEISFEETLKDFSQNICFLEVYPYVSVKSNLDLERIQLPSYLVMKDFIKKISKDSTKCLFIARKAKVLGFETPVNNVYDGTESIFVFNTSEARNAAFPISKSNSNKSYGDFLVQKLKEICK